MPEFNGVELKDLSVKKLHEVADQIRAEIREREEPLIETRDALIEAIHKDYIECDSYFPGPDYIALWKNGRQVTIRLEI